MDSDRSGYVAVNGLQMYYELYGRGRPLVLLHGGLHTFDFTFGAVLPSLAAQFQVVGVELQGHGHTPDIDRVPATATLADDVAALLDHLELPQVDLFGFSLGGLVGLDFAMRHPDRLANLIAASVHYRADGYYPEIRDPAAASADSTRLPSEQEFVAMREAYERVAPDPAHFEDFAAKIGRTVAGVGWSADEVRTIRAATLLIIGDHDFVRPEHALAMRELIPGAQLAMFPGTTHVDVMRRRDLVEPVVARFLRRDHRSR